MKKPLLNIESLSKFPDKTVIIVDNEKAATSAIKLFPENPVLTWAGGDLGYRDADFSVLKGRKILYSPRVGLAGAMIVAGEPDESGEESPGVMEIFIDLEIQFKMAPPSSDLPQGWDLSYAIDWTPRTAKKWLIEHTQQPINLNEITIDLEDESWRDVAEGVFDHELPPDDFPPVSAPHATTDPKHQYFHVLGFDGLDFYFLPHRSYQVVKFSNVALGILGNLNFLAPSNFWELEYAGKKGGVDLAMAQASLMSQSFAKGVFGGADIIRGRGGWLDDGRTVHHVGNKLIVDGIITELREFESEYIYENSQSLPFSDTPLSIEESRVFRELCGKLSFEKQVYGDLLAGWIVCAFLCGSLPWRPHLQVTSGAGTGKSWVLKNIIKKTLGDWAVHATGGTTEAGLRGALAGDAMSVVFDEAESQNNRASSVMEGVLTLMRQTSSDGGGNIIKGTATGGSITHAVRTCFAFASILPSAKQAADQSRITVVTLGQQSKERVENFKKNIAPTVKKTLTTKYCLDLQARCVKLTKIVVENAGIFSSAITAHLDSQRLGDQLGALLAGMYSLVSDDVISFDDAMSYVASQSWDSALSDQGEDDTTRLISMIIESSVQVKLHSSHDRTIAELISISAGLRTDDVLSLDKKAADATLQRHGIRVECVDGEFWASFANSHKGLGQILAGSQWASDWRRTLSRIPGAMTDLGKPTAKFAGSSSRYTAIKVGLIFAD